jgi:hypothetical protein
MCDLNCASVEQIAKLPGMDRAQALEITLWRPYASWAEVETVPGLGHGDVETLKAAGAMLSPVIAPPWPPAASGPGAPPAPAAHPQ